MWQDSGNKRWSSLFTKSLIIKVLQTNVSSVFIKGSKMTVCGLNF